MIRQSLRNAAYTVAPRSVVERYLHHKMVRQARRLSRLRDSRGDAPLLLEELWRSHFFRPLQKQSEIMRLVEIVGALRPETLCEIGAAGGGTTFLLAQAAADNATVITLDVAFTKSRRAAISRFGLKGQRLFCLREDSHDPQTVRLIRDCLDGRKLDVLYLDGDHSYEGIKADFQLYSPLVRAGGLVVFHDIVPDFKTRYGIETASYVGGVPQFWHELKAAHSHVEEIVEDYEQDGYGIGIMYWNDEGGTMK